MARKAISVLLALAAATAFGQAPAPRKRVVLVLSGGGAYGLMYLGALEWMERHRIPVDAIVGTSGGALVGGWYATGIEMLSDEDLRTPFDPKSKDDLRLRGVGPALKRIDFEHLFDSGPDYRNLSRPQKRERAAFPNDLFAGVSSSRTLRRDGLVPGQAVNFFLDWIGRDDPFGTEALPTPFRAVTVDAADADPEKWRPVVLGGPNPEIPLSLSRAIRASIAVPVLFAPVDEGPHRLIDGAVLDNFPTDVAIDTFSPDVLIGLRWDSGFGPDEFRRGQRGKDAAQKALVTFDPRPYRVDQFDQWRELAWIGYQGMEAQKADLLKYALSPEKFAAYRLERRRAPLSHRVRKVEGDVERLGEIRKATEGRDLDAPGVTEALGKALDRLVADEGLATAGYDLRPDGTLYVRTARHKGGPAFLRGGLELDANSGDRPWYGLRGRISDLRDRRFTYWGDLTLGNEPAFFGGLEYAFGRGWSISPSLHSSRDVQFNFRDGRRESELAILSSETRLALNYRPFRSLELSFGGFHGENQADDRHGRLFDPETGEYRGLFGRLSFDTTDDAVVPRQGTKVEAEVRGFDNLPRPLTQAFGQFDTYFGPREDVWGLHAGFGTSFGGDAPFSFKFRPRLSAYRDDEIRGDGFWSLGLSQTHEIAPLPFASGRLFSVARLESAWVGRDAFPGFSLGLLASTRAGAAYVGFGLAERGAVRLNFGLGRRF